MAIIRSTAIGSGSKSIGILTYRQSKGRTIASQKITSNPSKTEPQVRQRNSFGELGRLAQVMSSIIDLTFDRNRYGTSRNTFIQSNKQLMKYIREISDYNPDMPPVKNLCTYLSNPTAGLTVMLSKGALNVINSFGWDEQSQLVGTMYLSRDYAVGDQLTIYAPFSYQMSGGWFDAIKVYTKTLNESDLSVLTVANRFEVSKLTIPGLEELTDLPEGANEARFLVCGVVADSKKRTTSYLTLLPEQNTVLRAASQTVSSEQEMTITFTNAELFAAKVADQAVGGYALFSPLRPDMHYPVTAISKNASQQPVGLVFGPPAPSSFEVPLAGESQGAISIVKNGEVIAVMENVISPQLVM